MTFCHTFTILVSQHIRFKSACWNRYGNNNHRGFFNFKGRYIFVTGGGGGPGYFRIFLRKKSWPFHFLEWINAWPFRNTQTKTSDPPPYLFKTKLTGSENNKLEVLLCWWHIGCGNKWKRKSREVERWRRRVVPEVVGSSPSSLSAESSPETDF